MVLALFPGQGSQTVSMGRALHDADPQARLRFEEANDILKADLRKICFEGPAETLSATQNTQPALYLVGFAAFEYFTRAGGIPTAAAGHSLGEYTALAAAGVFDFATGLKLVRRRGELMSQAQQGAMAAVMGISREKLEAVCRECSTGAEVVVPANFNSPDQTVISGSVLAVKRAAEKLPLAGAKRVIPLKVSGAFHSPLMQKAAEGMKAELSAAHFLKARFPVLCNVTAQPESKAEAFKDLLYRQLFSAVRWVESFAKAGAGRAVELGPGKVLAGLVARINPALSVLPGHTPDEIGAAAKATAGEPSPNP